MQPIIEQIISKLERAYPKAYGYTLTIEDVHAEKIYDIPPSELLMALSQFTMLSQKDYSPDHQAKFLFYLRQCLKTRVHTWYADETTLLCHYLKQILTDNLQTQAVNSEVEAILCILFQRHAPLAQSMVTNYLQHFGNQQIRTSLLFACLKNPEISFSAHFLPYQDLVQALLKAYLLTGNQNSQILKVATKFLKLLAPQKITESLLTTVQEVYEQITLYFDEVPQVEFLKFIVQVAEHFPQFNQSHELQFVYRWVRKCEKNQLRLIVIFSTIMLQSISQLQQQEVLKQVILPYCLKHVQEIYENGKDPQYQKELVIEILEIEQLSWDFEPVVRAWNQTFKRFDFQEYSIKEFLSLILPSCLDFEIYQTHQGMMQSELEPEVLQKILSLLQRKEAIQLDDQAKYLLMLFLFHYMPVLKFTTSQFTKLLKLLKQSTSLPVQISGFSAIERCIYQHEVIDETTISLMFDLLLSVKSDQFLSLGMRIMAYLVGQYQTLSKCFYTDIARYLKKLPKPEGDFQNYLWAQLACQAIEHSSELNTNRLYKKILEYCKPIYVIQLLQHFEQESIDENEIQLQSLLQKIVLETPEFINLLRPETKLTNLVLTHYLNRNNLIFEVSEQVLISILKLGCKAVYLLDQKHMPWFSRMKYLCEHLLQFVPQLQSLELQPVLLTCISLLKPALATDIDKTNHFNLLSQVKICKKADILFAIEMCQQSESTDYAVNMVQLLIDRIEQAADVEYQSSKSIQETILDVVRGSTEKLNIDEICFTQKLLPMESSVGTVVRLTSVKRKLARFLLEKSNQENLGEVLETGPPRIFQIPNAKNEQKKQQKIGNKLKAKLSQGQVETLRSILAYAEIQISYF